MAILFSLLFLLLSILLGIFITGTGMTPATHIRVGLRALLFGYLLGVTMLIIAVAFFS